MTTCLEKSCSFCLPRVSFVNCCQFMYLIIFLLVLRAGCWIWLYLCLSFYWELQPFIPNASRLSIWQFNNLSHRLKGNLSKSKHISPNPTPNCRSSCEKVTSSNVINVLKGALGGCAWSQSFLLVAENRRSRLDSPFCIITEHRKFESSQTK